MNNYLVLKQQGFFAGEFVVFNKQQTFSIGNYLELFLKESPYNTGETILDPYKKEKPIIAFPLVITECCYNSDIEVIMKKPVGRALKHWIDCLEIGKISVVIPFKYEYRKYVWYMSKINGWVPGLFGKVQAPQRSN